MRKLLLPLVSIILVSVSNPAFAKPINDNIIAIVNDDVITLKDLKDYIGSIYRQLKIENHSPEEIQEIMSAYEEKGINQLVEDKLILAAANEKGLELRSEAVNKRIKEIKDKYRTENEFLTALDAQGMTITDLKTKLMNQMKARYIIDIEVKDKVFVNPQDVTKYYNQHMDEFTRKTKYSLQSVFVSFNKGKQEARNRAAEARAKMAAGEDFDKIEKAFSESPSVGTIEEGQMVPAIEKEVFNLKIGEVSDLVEVEGGIYVFKVTGILPGRKETLTEAKERINNKLYDDEFQRKFRNWIEKLRKKNYVEIRS
jgi:peptidyl-prolyl cis-trans isomerase SurA